jgi:hypothetical protein
MRRQQVIREHSNWRGSRRHGIPDSNMNMIASRTIRSSIAGLRPFGPALLRSGKSDLIRSHNRSVIVFLAMLHLLSSPGRFSHEMHPGAIVRQTLSVVLNFLITPVL